mgnify:CR=1 FL=1
MITDIFVILEIGIEETTEQERQIIVAFSFGLINAYAIEEKVEPARVHGVMIGVLIKDRKSVV